ncbi:Hypothetical protein PBC10988_22320 [Planctomycetales bacterium 10988]|nr:Hypothetical protein PBC10988_22320 [Planctomycetales bacterium 10988]
MSNQLRMSLGTMIGIVVVSVGMLLESPSAFAQRSPLERRVRGFDSNEDGNISIEEFRGPRDRFRLLDRDQDGVISSAEVTQYFSRSPTPARASDQNDTQADGVLRFTYPSTIDGASCTGTIWIPEASKEMPPEKYPLVAFLGGGPGVGTIPNDILAECQKRNWIAMGLAGRSWPRGSLGDCGFTVSMAYLDHPNPAIGPGQQDVLDGIDWALTNHPAEPKRVYLCGFSLGGRGTYMMGLKCPDRFAAIAPFAPATDMFELDIRTSESRASYPCRMAIAEGVVGTSPRSATLRSMQSGRFLIENAFNLPIFHGHGTEDGLAYNLRSKTSYAHGYNMTIDSSWRGVYEFQGKQFDFGHTPTLAELHQRHPDGYPFAYMFTRIGHAVDKKWLEGTSTNQGEGVPHPEAPNRLIGAFDFFERHQLKKSPETVVFKTYTDNVSKAYWLAIDIQRPWENLPGAVRAKLQSPHKLAIEAARLTQISIDLDLAQLNLTSSQPLRIDVSILEEPCFDPALMPQKSDSQDLKIILKSETFSQSRLDDLTISGANGEIQYEDQKIIIPVLLDPAGPRAILIQ